MDIQIGQGHETCKFQDKHIYIDQLHEWMNDHITYKYGNREID